MGTLKWYQRDPHAALAGMNQLTLEERGAYNTVLDLIYMADGALPDEPAAVCRWLGTNSRRWRRIRSTLIKKQKLYVLGGCLRNERADRVIATAHRKARTRAARRFTVVK
jgi:uncharacterized protein YdaU (DUF1376 family)